MLGRQSCCRTLRCHGNIIVFQAAIFTNTLRRSFHCRRLFIRRIGLDGEHLSRLVMEKYSNSKIPDEIGTLSINTFLYHKIQHGKLGIEYALRLDISMRIFTFRSQPASQSAGVRPCCSEDTIGFTLYFSKRVKVSKPRDPLSTRVLYQADAEFFA